MAEHADIAIVGAGAAGLAAAIFAAETRPAPGRVVLFDGAVKIGAKILVSGGGRCNVTHTKVTPEDYQGSRPVVRNILRAFDVARTIGWFKDLGVELKEEATGKLFPVTDDADTVLSALLGRCAVLGVEVKCDHRVNGLEPHPEGFALQTSRGLWSASKVILATGGRSLPKTGSDGAGWDMARALGHSVTPTYPALVPLVLEDGFFHTGLSGISQDVELTTHADGKRIDRRAGSLLWTHFGISGPVVMDASRFWVIARAQGQNPELRCAFLPGEDFEKTERWLIDAAASFPRRALGTILGERLPRRVVEALCSHLGQDGAREMGRMTREDRRQFVHALTGLSLPVVRDRGWNYAEVTAGGVPLGEVDFRTMESRRVAGLHLVGEMLDCEGRIGGFNFQWAWATGYLAGRAAAGVGP